ncbi:MAG TPA: EscU/YscU/HrcU family type III secretion system export apparatus switch protein [Oscillospiraceae bacterium]|nr:EscU/YscU/HrcU family type III secretion system export apparatus switch protein [Oscillospiraceae bacterium]
MKDNNKKRKQAAAIKYDMEKDNAPTVTATGRGTIAEKIIEKAIESNIAIYRDERLVKELLQFKVGTEIPPELYEIVAEILVFIEGIDRKKGSSGYPAYS